MLSFFIILLIIFVLWPLLTAGWKIFRQFRMMRRFMNDPMGEMRRPQAILSDSGSEGPTTGRKSHVRSAEARKYPAISASIYHLLKSEFPRWN